MRLIIFALLMTGCASTLAERCLKWDHVKTEYELGAGVTYKSEKYVCTEFKSE